MSVPAEQATLTTQTTMHALKPVEPPANQPLVSMGFATLQGFELMQRAGKALAASSLVPKEYIGNLPNCIIALEMASRIGASPLMVMQNLYVVYGRPSWSAKFLIACFNQCGRFAAIRYRFSGTEGKDDWTCQAYSKELATGDVIIGPVISIGLAKKEGWYQKNGSKWQTIPQLMLMYRSAAWLVNTHAPEISMGINTEEEIRDVFDAERGADGQYRVTTESLRQASELVDQSTGEITPPAGTRPEPEVTPQPDVQGAIAKLRECTTLKALEKAWKEVVAEFNASKVSVPIDVEAAKNDRQAAIEQDQKL